METQRFVEGINILSMPLLEMLQYVDCQWDAEKQRYQAAGQKHYFMLLQSWCENTMRCVLVLHFTPVKGGLLVCSTPHHHQLLRSMYDADAP